MNGYPDVELEEAEWPDTQGRAARPPTPGPKAFFLNQRVAFETQRVHAQSESGTYFPDPPAYKLCIWIYNLENGAWDWSHLSSDQVFGLAEWLRLHGWHC
jgi:hypothetical protein